MRFLPALAVPLVALSFAGCATAPTDSTPQNAAVEQAPAFATDEEALAAAQAAYAEYLAVSDQIAREGGANPERLQGLVTKDQFKLEQQNANSLKDQGLHSEGISTFDTFHVANADLDSFSAYVCLDVSNSNLVNSSGEIINSANREKRWPLLVTFDLSIPTNILISGSDTWTGQNFC